MTHKTCCIFGQEKMSVKKQDQIYKLLYDKIEELIKDGFTNFIFDWKCEFSFVVASAILKLNKMYPNIKRIYYQAYEMEDIDLLRYGYDEIIPPFKNVPESNAVAYRNHSMVDNSDYCIFYVNTKPSDAKKAMRFAKNLNKPYVNLYTFVQLL